MKYKVHEVKRGNVVVKVYERQRVKAGANYKEFIVVDRSSGKRQRKGFNDLAAAKAQAAEIAEAIQHGNVEASRWESGLRLELRKALETVEPTGMSILPATQLFAQAVQILGNPQELLAACQHYKQNRPDKPITPTLIETAVEAFKASRKTRISPRRFRTEECYFRRLTKQFSGRMIHEITVEAVDLLVGAQKWASKTRNDFLTSVAPLFEFAEGRYWVPKGTNPIKEVARARETQPPVEIFEPWEMKQILNRLAVAAPDLVPFMAIWGFAGIRKEEVARMSWPQVNRGLMMGHFELQARATKNGQYRTVPVQDNLRDWLTAYQQDNGTILPPFWLAKTKKGSPRLDEITRYISRNTGVEWRDNAPRHSFGSYFFKVCKDPGEVTRVMGTTLEKFQRNYWNKSQVVTDASAREWFSIRPDFSEKVVPINVAATASPTQEPLNSAAG